MNKCSLLTFLSLLLLSQQGIVYAQTCSASIVGSTPTNQFIDHNNGTLTDKKTGLMWKKCSEGQTWNTLTGGCNGKTVRYSWRAALQRAKTVNNSGGFANNTDWRVPNIKELASIVEPRCSKPTINSAVFPSTPSAIFWSTSSSALNGESAWHISFKDGDDDWKNKAGNLNQIRLVRGGL